MQINWQSCVCTSPRREKCLLLCADVSPLHPWVSTLGGALYQKSCNFPKELNDNGF